VDFSLSEEQNIIFNTAKDFGEETIAPFAYEWEKKEEIPRDALKKAGDLGLGGMIVSEEDGGAGMTRLDGTLVFEALAMSCPSVSSFISIHNMSAWVISKRGNKGLKDIFLNKLISLDDVCSYCLTEPGSGSDAAALRTKADITNEGYDITGSKSFISGGGFSDLYVVLVRTGDASPNGISMVVVRNGTEGLSFGKKEQKMGWKAQPTAVVQFDDCSIPSTNLVGEEGSGFKYAMEGLDGGRLNIAAASLGGAQKSLNIAKAYAKERTAFGKPISKFQSIEFKLADMETQLEAARLFLRSAAWKLDKQKSDATVSVAMAKRFVTDVAFEVSNNALQILGGYGYLEEYGIEKIVRDLRVHQILEGTNEIMRVIIARSILAN
jgi:hypothetical protein